MGTTVVGKSWGLSMISCPSHYRAAAAQPQIRMRLP